MISDAESVEQSALLFVTFGDGALFLPKRSDSRYAIMLVIFDDKKNTNFAIALPYAAKLVSVSFDDKNMNLPILDNFSL